MMPFMNIHDAFIFQSFVLYNEKINMMLVLIQLYISIKDMMSFYFHI